MDPEEKILEKHLMNNARSLEFYYRNREHILDKRKNNPDRKMRQCLYQQRYYQKKRELKDKQPKIVEIQPQSLQTQQEPVFTLSFS